MSLYPEGIASHSPGLPAQAGYPGKTAGAPCTLKGFRHPTNHDDGTLSGYRTRLLRDPG